MKYRVIKDIKENVYSITFEVVEQSPEFLEAVSDRGQKILNVGGKFTKKVVENVVTKVPIIDESGDPVLDDSGNPSFNEVLTPTEREEVLLNIGDSFKYFPKELPFTKSFSKNQYHENVEDVANLYKITLRERMDKLIDELKSDVDNFSGTSEYIR